MWDRDEPRLDVYRPQKALNPAEVEATEENLAQMVNNRRVSDAVKLYERIRADGKDISPSLQVHATRMLN